MFTRRYIWFLVLPALACTPTQRLKEVSQKDDERTEAQIQGERHLKQAESLFDSGDAHGAQQEYLKALREWPQLYKAHLGLGDVYELEGDRFSAVCEYIAHTEIAPKARQYLDRMLAYVFAKFARHPSGPREIKDEERAVGMLALSEAIAKFREGKYAVGLRSLPQVKQALPRAGFAEYVEGMLLLAKGDKQAGLEALEKSVARNSYFARRLLADGEEKRIPDLLERLERVLEGSLQKHPADIETAFMLSVVRYRMKKYPAALKAAQGALAWGKARWDVLLVKAAAHHRLGQEIKMEQALADLKAIQPDLSVAFRTYEPSLFNGELAGSVNELARTKFADSLAEPKRSYFLWRLSEEEGSKEAQSLREAFFGKLMEKYKSDEFENLPATETPERKPKGLDEFMGEVQERVSGAMGTFARCDASRRPLRSNPSGRITVRVELARDGTVGQVGIEENTTGDDWLAYCIVRKIVAMRFPKLIRATEIFKIPVMFGPEVDAIDKGSK